MKNILILGGDGFCGWPTALHLSAQGHRVTIVDNLSRRAIDEELGTESLTPIAPIMERLATWEAVSGETIPFAYIDVARDYEAFRDLIADLRPDTIIQFAEQRAAPYSMKDTTRKIFTIDNNVNATHNVLAAITETGIDAHVVHLGTMGVYGYDESRVEIPEGYLDVYVPGENRDISKRSILYPTNPGSVHHLTKSMDQLMFQFYAKNDGLRITDLQQGIVWGTQTEETRRHPALINRFDYDGDFGTVLNRFLMQAAVGHPLTVHGTGGQTRAFINIQDTVRCIAMAVDNPPSAGARVKIRNQITECHRVRDLARMISEVTGARIAFVDNPRNEPDENELVVSNKSFIDLGLEPVTLESGLLTETIEVSRKYADRCRMEMIPCVSTWTDRQRPGIAETPMAA